MLGACAFGGAALVAALISWSLAYAVESRSVAAVTSRLLAEGYTWAEVSADGLQVRLSGTAPDEAMRFRAVNLAGTVVDSGRLRDDFDVTPAQSIEPPRFSVEMLRNDDGIQLIGLLPEGADEAALVAAVQALTPDLPLSEMLETAAYPAPQGWDVAMDFAFQALKMLPRSKISVAADGIHITAIAGSEAEKRSMEAELTRSTPEGLAVITSISAPRPVLTPFTLRFVTDAAGARFDACAADTERARSRIVAAALAAGLQGRVLCTIGLGVPSPSWAEAVELGIAAAAELGSTSITFSDADVTLAAGEDVAQADFDRVVGELRAGLPDVFSFQATLAKAETAAASGPAEFTASRAAETGRVELRGRLTDDRLQAAVDSFARAEFGAQNVYVATRLDADLPDGWSERVLVGLAALSLLDHGTLLVRPDTVEVKGVTGSQGARARMSQILSERLGQGQTFKVDVVYDEALDPLAALPTPVECIERVEAVMAGQKIAFAPGSAEIDAAAGALIDRLAASLKGCEAVEIEIAGHTDAQGSEGGNQALSQARAEAVLLALQGRQVDVSALKAVGYGEARPLADNGNEAGREANRRIEFTLIGGPERPTANASPAAAAAAAVAAAEAPAVETPAAEPAAPDFSGDDSPSVAPVEKTLRPQPRPDQDG
jgi:OOP family OmpA-OmpF porin